ncbi:MAG TPA: hypothetical protein VKG25_02750 [Bryobacteraceae bacterium]|nr:hypothetical protein [Bryobacteraceae bacterium]
MDEPGAVTDLVQRGRRRALLNLLVRHISLALAIAFGGAILLLLLGTQVLNWYWLVVLFAGGFAYSAWRGRARIPSAYQVAQSIDRRLDLKDALSTAFYFLHHPHQEQAPEEQAIVARQRAAAEELARHADLRVAIPFAASRSLYACAALAMAALGLFAVRYGVTHSLDLRQSLVRIPFQDFLGDSNQIADAKKRLAGQKPGGDNQQPGSSVDPEHSETPDMDPASDDALRVTDTPEVNNPDNGYDPAKAQAAKDKSKDPQQDPGDPGANGEQNQGNDSPDGASQDGSRGKNKQDKDAKNGNRQSNSGENSSLADKMRDALSNLMAKLKTPSNNGDSKRSQPNAQNGQQPGKQNGGKDQNGQAEAKQQGDASNNPDAQGDQQQTAEQSQSAQGQSNGKDSQRAGAPDSKSGVGKQDGDKSLREAEQLAAMGKISELIGKRAQNVSGEMMVEVSSGKQQQLRTQYTNRNATHSEAGGEINRDEVPLAYQQYIEKYFEAIRKVPEKKTK